jgi:hypothetical protein
MFYILRPKWGNQHDVMFFLNMIYDKCICFNDDNTLNMIPLIPFPHIKHFPETMVDDGGCRG